MDLSIARSLTKQSRLNQALMERNNYLERSSIILSSYRRAVVIIFATVLVTIGLLSSRGGAQQQPAATASGSSTELDSVHTRTTHYYSNRTDEAADALVITEVKTALNEDGVADGYPVAVDCDHGVVTLTGVVASAADAQHARVIAQQAEGVTAVKNQLTWHGASAPAATP